MEKTRIRLAKVEQRLNKNRMHTSDKNIQAIVHASLRIDSLSNSLDEAWRDLYTIKKFDPIAYQAHPENFEYLNDDFDLILSLEKEMEKLREKITRLEKKTGESEDEIMSEYKAFNTSRRTTSY